MSKDKDTEDHRNFVTVALTELKGDIEQVKNIVERNERWLRHLNGTVKRHDSDISRIKGIGGTIAALIISILGWFKIGDFR